MKKIPTILPAALLAALIVSVSLANEPGQNNQMPPPPPEQFQETMNQQPDNPLPPPPEAPADGQMPPAMPSDQQSDGQMPPPPEQFQETMNQQPDNPPPPPPEAPADGQVPPAMPNDQQNNGGQMPPAMPSDQQNNGGQMPPAMPSDQQNNGGQTPPAMPGDQQNNGGQMPPAMPGGQQNGGMMPGGMPGVATVTEYTAAATITENSSGETYSSSSDGENAVLVKGHSVSMTGTTVSKSGSASGENADFTGVNAAVLATDGANLTLDDASVTTDGAHANGVFSYGSGTTVNVSNTTIKTTGNNSGGLMTTGGGTLNASNLTVSTSGNSSAAIRTDRGGGTVTVNKGSYDTSGVGSPAIYSTADITVLDATLSASNSEAVVIEGGNSVNLTDVNISGSNTKLNGQSTQKTNVLIYQSMSGDASEGNSTFTMTGGTMTAETGSMFHVTNVTTTITLQNVDFTYSADSNVFLDASADSWGRSGKNGGNVTLNLVDQEITGSILSDSISTVAVSLDSSSKWTLTGDSYVTSFTGDLSNVNTNGYTLYVNGTAVK